jgi:hypothetical protein
MSTDEARTERRMARVPDRIEAVTAAGQSREQRAAANRQHVRDQVTQRDPSLARALDGLFREPEPRQQRETRGSR